MLHDINCSSTWSKVALRYKCCIFLAHLAAVGLEVLARCLWFPQRQSGTRSLLAAAADDEDEQSWHSEQLFGLSGAFVPHQGTASCTHFYCLVDQSSWKRIRVYPWDRLIQMFPISIANVVYYRYKGYLAVNLILSRNFAFLFIIQVLKCDNLLLLCIYLQIKNAFFFHNNIPQLWQLCKRTWLLNINM